MKKYLQTTLISIISLSSLSAYSQETEKKFTVGAGIFASAIAYDNPRVGSDDEFSGLGLSASYAFTDNFAVRGNLYSLEHNDFSDVDNKGFDLVGYFGTGLATHGFKAYIGGGLFSENITFRGFDDDFGGLQLSGGLGYNWSVVALDFTINIRDASDYEDAALKYSGINTDAAAASGSLLLSARF